MRSSQPVKLFPGYDSVVFAKDVNGDPIVKPGKSHSEQELRDAITDFVRDLYPSATGFSLVIHEGNMETGQPTLETVFEDRKRTYEELLASV